MTMEQDRHKGTWDSENGWSIEKTQGWQYHVVAGIIIGGLVIAAGATFSIVYSFQESILPVFVGILLFFLGYRLSQFTLYRYNTTASLRKQITEQVTKVRPRNMFLMLAGGFFLSYGFQEFVQAVLTNSIQTAVVAGILSLGGYAIAHLAINNTLI